MIPPTLRAGLTALMLTASAFATADECPPPPACPACPVCPVCPACPTAPPAETPRAAPLQAAQWTDLTAWASDNHAAAWPALLQSCSTLVNRNGWQAVCAAATTLGPAPSRQRARAFFETHFVPWRAVNPDGSREGMVTGYYEPVIAGSRKTSLRHRWPIHAPPADLVSVDLGEQYPELRHMRLRGRVVDNRLLPYWTRGEIERRGADFDAPILFWAADPLDLFFLQVQGSGQLQLEDGTRVRIGYADHNGHPYASIGRWLIERGELTLDQASMQGIRQWARENPDRLGELLAANPSYVFFRELPPSDGGPIGALGVPLTAGRSMAVDPRFVPLGAPVYLDTTYPLSERPLRRLMLAQDTGGAIKGVVRADFYWGSGYAAGEQAGRMRQQGRMWVLLPKGMKPGE